MTMRLFPLRALLTCALAAGCVVPDDLGADASDSSDSSDSDTGDSEIARRCNDRAQCFAHTDDWTAWAYYYDVFELALDHGLLEHVGRTGEAECYRFDPSRIQVCKITRDGVDLFGRLIVDLDLAISDCAETSPPWHYTLEAEHGACYGAVGPVAVLLDTETPLP